LLEDQATLLAPETDTLDLKHDTQPDAFVVVMDVVVFEYFFDVVFSRWFVTIDSAMLFEVLQHQFLMLGAGVFCRTWP